MYIIADTWCNLYLFAPQVVGISGLVSGFLFVFIIAYARHKGLVGS